jgi:quinol-cytochrome oxidoreductase complex cytochrome b subunit
MQLSEMTSLCKGQGISYMRNDTLLTLRHKKLYNFTLLLLNFIIIIIIIIIIMIDGVRRSMTSHGLVEEDTKDRDSWRNLVLGEGRPL